MPRSKEKIIYEVDPHNRLVIKKTRAKSKLPRFRQVLDGRFKTGKNNSLTYHIKAPVPKGRQAPHQVKLRGKWSLSKNHDLRFTLDKWRRQTFGDRLTLQGDIIDVNKNSLAFAITTSTNKGSTSIYTLKLEGSWQADSHNRLTFRVNKGRREPDILAFTGAWEIGKNYQIIYKYEKERLVRKLKQTHTLTFKGHWDIADKKRISYVIDRNSGSVLNFQTSLGIFRDNYIKYELGIGLSRRQQPIKRIITLFGTWKIKKNRGLLFEVGYGKDKIHSLAFGAEARLTQKDTVLFKLKAAPNSGIGTEMQLSRKVLKGDGQAFIRLLKSSRESAVFLGSGYGW